jgi:hypothetical protein
MGRAHRAPRGAGEHCRDDERDHFVQVGPGQRPVAADAPEVELVRLADVQAVDDVTPVDEPGTGDDLVGLVRKRAQRGGHHGGRVRPQHAGGVDVAGVTGLPGRPARYVRTGQPHAAPRASVIASTSSCIACGPRSGSDRSRIASARSSSAGVMVVGIAGSSSSLQVGT